ncbi:MAG: hypothetical protein BJ554DRAFT_5855 [Olpidium bornovanus]|uniref:Uncharacterized protein n=1 Tax=Olpidium bornovanus TaxID=278681 RepID=A0A8H8DKP2_9FUNG|nr:MAG: hypothetical protein BJ554DRAFT_5855 [Olpidium bornovanus]
MTNTYNQHVDLPDELLRQIAQENLALGLRRQEKERARRLALEEDWRAAEARERAARDAEAARAARRRKSSARAPKSAAPPRLAAAAAEGGRPASASAALKQTQIRPQTAGKTIAEERFGAK